MPRAMWSGAISFGLVNIPVKLYKATAATSGKQVSFHQLHKTCGTRLKHIRWCPKDEVEVPWDEVVKGYELDKGKYVPVTDEELDQLLPEEDFATIAIDSFVALGDVDPIFYDRAYYIAPDSSPKPYALLHEVLRDTGKVAVARVLLRTRSHLALVRVLADHLLLETMYYAHEIVDAGEVPGVPAGKGAHVDKRQLDMARQLVGSMSTDWQPEKYKDDYSKKVLAVIEAKVKGGEVVESAGAVAEEGRGQVVDLLEALRRSVEATRGKGHTRGEALPDPAEQHPLAVVKRPARRAAAGKRARHSRRRAS